MRIPFGPALRIGTDIVASHRILSVTAPNARRLERLTQRFLHPKEIQDLTTRFPRWRSIETSTDHERQCIASWLAGRWAAKEAGKKAWGAHVVGFRDLRVEVAPEGNGRVELVCSAFASTKEVKGKEPLEQVAQLSISHDGDFAVATVLATPLHPEVSADLGVSGTDTEADPRLQRSHNPASVPFALRI